MEFDIKFRPNKPTSHHLNDKVERTQKTDTSEFYRTIDTTTDILNDLLAEWQNYY